MHMDVPLPRACKYPVHTHLGFVHVLHKCGHACCTQARAPHAHSPLHGHVCAQCTDTRVYTLHMCAAVVWGYGDQAQGCHGEGAWDRGHGCHGGTPWGGDTGAIGGHHGEGIWVPWADMVAKGGMGAMGGHGCHGGTSWPGVSWGGGTGQGAWVPWVHVPVAHMCAHSRHTHSAMCLWHTRALPPLQGRRCPLHTPCAHTPTRPLHTQHVHTRVSLPRPLRTRRDGGG